MIDRTKVLIRIKGGRMPGLGWPQVMGRLIFLGSSEQSRTAYKSIGGDLGDLEKAVVLEYLRLPMPLELRKLKDSANFADLVDAREIALTKLRKYFQVF